jgi:hypothetical protein
VLLERADELRALDTVLEVGAPQLASWTGTAPHPAGSPPT